MAQFRIVNRISGSDLGVYEAEDAQGALEAFARDAGYRSYAEACEVAGDDGSDLRVTRVEE